MQVSIEGLCLTQYDQLLTQAPEVVPFDHAPFVLAGMRAALLEREAALFDPEHADYWAADGDDLEELFYLTDTVAILDGMVSAAVADEYPTAMHTDTTTWFGPFPRHCTHGRKSKPVTRLGSCAFQ